METVLIFLFANAWKGIKGIALLAALAIVFAFMFAALIYNLFCDEDQYPAV